ncbi:hypothetical protein [Microcoleus phage My-WqHQDG]|nr:hypothetical protein [Microcoleus phage My-WqHQDG]
MTEVIDLDLMNVELGKWPLLVVTGNPVTPEQAMEILIRTDSLDLRLVSSKAYGDEYQRLQEHGGRLFRLARFACRFRDWTIDPDTLTACRKFAPDAFGGSPQCTFIRGKKESFGEEWAKVGYCKEYLLMLDTMRFLEQHSISPPDSVNWYPKYPWYSLWIYANKPPIKEFSDN